QPAFPEPVVRARHKILTTADPRDRVQQRRRIRVDGEIRMAGRGGALVFVVFVFGAGGCGVVPGCRRGRTRGARGRPRRGGGVGGWGGRARGGLFRTLAVLLLRPGTPPANRRLLPGK